MSLDVASVQSKKGGRQQIRQRCETKRLLRVRMSQGRLNRPSPAVDPQRRLATRLSSKCLSIDYIYASFGDCHSAHREKPSTRNRAATHSCLAARNCIGQRRILYSTAAYDFAEQARQIARWQKDQSRRSVAVTCRARRQPTSQCFSTKSSSSSGTRDSNVGFLDPRHLQLWMAASTCASMCSALAP